jgi:hypothetical protein
MGDLHVASARDLDAAPDRSLQRRAADSASPLLDLQSQAGNAAVSRMIRESGSVELQRSCGCSGGGCSCGGGLQESEGAESESSESASSPASAAG